MGKRDHMQWYIILDRVQVVVADQVVRYKKSASAPNFPAKKNGPPPPLFGVVWCVFTSSMHLHKIWRSTPSPFSRNTHPKRFDDLQFPPPALSVRSILTRHKTNTKQTERFQGIPTNGPTSTAPPSKFVWGLGASDKSHVGVSGSSSLW